MKLDTKPRLVTKEYRTISQIKGPLLFIERISDIAYDEIVIIRDPDNQVRLGRVLEVDERFCMVQVFTGTQGLDLKKTSVRFTGDVARLDVSHALLGRVLNGIGQLIDHKLPIVPERSLDINGSPINPVMRAYPSEFIQTGISAIDGLNTLIRGQKLPIFSGAGLPANELVAQIVAHANVVSHTATGQSNEQFAIVFAAMGITHREASYFLNQFENTKAMERSVIFLNHANDPAIERLYTPRAALTVAEYLAFVHHLHVLAIMTDMSNYCNALRELAAAREEVPGRYGYPGYMYSDLASIYERAGRIRGNPGSLTQIVILTVPNDDITHPISDLTGYITEGQIVLSRELHHKGISPPIDVLPSLSRLMKSGIGENRTRGDHRYVAEQLYALYAQGRDLRRLVSVIGEAALSRDDKLVLAFTDKFEQEFISQGSSSRSIYETLNLAWKLFSDLPQILLKRIPETIIEAYGA